jgi:cytochrome P450
MSTDTDEPNAIVVELMTEAGREDPYPLYRRLHALGPASFVAEGFVVANGYTEINAVLRNPAFGMRGGAVEPGTEVAEHASLATLNKSILDINPPDHTRARRLMSAVFTPRRTAGLAPAIASTTEALLDSMAKTGADGRTVDFMDEFAFRLPVSVICELIGVPEADRPRFRSLAHDLGAALELISDVSTLGPADAAALELTEYFTALVAERRAAPREDLISALIHETDGEDARLSEEELLGNLVLLLFAGFETTTNLFGNGLAILFERPQLVAALQDGSLAPAAFVEEVLRYDSPVQLTSRAALRDGLEIAGVPVSRNAEVLLLLGAANRDAARFRDPEEFEPDRPDNQPLSFGAGGHFCLGAALARLEAVTAFPLLLDRFPQLAPAEGAERIRSDRLVLRGYRTLPVTVG